MTAGPTTFMVGNSTDIVGKLVKQPVDIALVTIDFTFWLDTGETLASLQSFSIVANGTPPWQLDYPFATPIPSPPADTNPLTLNGAAVSGSQVAQVSVGAGTSGLEYTGSFIVTTTSGRQKEIDLTISVIAPDNPLITSAAPPTQSVTIVTATAVLAVGTGGSVFVENGTAAPITITLPSLPVIGHSVTIKDVTGNAGSYNITIQGAGGTLIDGEASLILTINYSFAELVWFGTGWVQA